MTPLRENLGLRGVREGESAPLCALDRGRSKRLGADASGLLFG